MKKLFKYLVCLTILVMIMALFTGCILTGKVTGGGWFMNEGTEGTDSKCTFGFNAQGDECLEYKGQFQFNSHDGEKIHAKVMALLDFGETYAWFHGVANDGREVDVYVEDKGQPGPDPGDSIKIWIDADLMDLLGTGDYEGDLGGGNIQVH